MGILEIILIGLVVGAIARLLVPGRQPLGILGTLAIGVAGALLGWWIGRGLVGARAADNPWLWAIGGAVLLVLAWQAMSRRRSVFH
jgi:uncharacterized membrane protein YeaQ/YmgE (transglycosylase-associated protein family)